MCLGINMAYEEAKCCLVMIVQNGYKFELVENQNVIYHATAVLGAKNGIKMRVNKVV